MDKYYYKYKEIDDKLYDFETDATDLTDVAEEVAEEIWGNHDWDLHWGDGDHFEIEIYDKDKILMTEVTVWVDFSHPVFIAEVNKDET